MNTFRDDEPRAVPVPADSKVARFYAATDLADAFEIRLPPDAAPDAETLGRFMLDQQASWVHGLMRVRDAMVAGLGLKTASQLQAAGVVPDAPPRVGIFRLYESSPHELLLGEDDRHLDFRVSVLRRRRADGDTPVDTLTVSTVVDCHNRVGRTYIALIAPFHRAVVRSMLRRAARAGWPRQILRPAESGQ